MASKYIKNLRRYFLYLLLLLVEKILNHLPLKLVLKIGEGGGFLAYKLLKKERQKTLANLEIAFASCKGKQERELIAGQVFKNLGKNLVEWIRIPQWDKEDLNQIVTEVEGMDNLKAALALGNGVIIVTAHLGCWELLACYLVEQGYPGVVIAKKIYYEKFNDYLEKIRFSHNVEIVYRTESARKSLNHLKQNKMLGILPDQDIAGIDGVFVDFFGQPAYTPKGPVFLAMLSKAPLLPCFIVRKDDDTHKIIIKPALELEQTGDKERDLLVNTQKWSREVEACIARYPGQWVWMHRRWKKREEYQDDVGNKKN